MEIFKLKKFVKGWVVGDFVPSLIQTKDFEVAVKDYRVGVEEAMHVHKIAKEITVITSGKFMMNEQVLEKGDIVYLLPGESAEFSCLKSGTTVCIKTPSVKGDKYLI